MPFLVHEPVDGLLCSALTDPSSADWSDVFEIGKRYLQGRRDIVVYTDWSAQTAELDPGSLATILRVLSSDNPAIKRSGFLLTPSPFMLQMSRLTVRAANPKRRILYTPDGIRDWLNPALSPEGPRRSGGSKRLSRLETDHLKQPLFGRWCMYS